MSDCPTYGCINGAGHDDMCTIGVAEIVLEPPPLTGLVGIAPDLGGGACSVCVVRWNRRHDPGDVKHDECRRILDDETGGRQ